MTHSRHIKTHCEQTLGKKGVKITEDKYSLDFNTMNNGMNWNSFPIDIDLLVMMQDVIAEYLAQYAQSKKFDCPVIGKACVFYMYQLDRNGDIAICFCNHEGNKEDTEGNCTLALCPLLKVTE